MNIIAEDVYIDKFIPEVGVHKIEQKIIDTKDVEISDNHLIAYRMSKEEIAYNWNLFVLNVIKNYFLTNAITFEEKNLFQTKFDDRLWSNLENFVRNLSALPLW